MTKQEREKFEALEKRVADLERRPVYVPYWPPVWVQPYEPYKQPYWTVTCGSATSNGTSGFVAT